MTISARDAAIGHSASDRVNRRVCNRPAIRGVLHGNRERVLAFRWNAPGSLHDLPSVLHRAISRSVAGSESGLESGLAAESAAESDRSNGSGESDQACESGLA